MYNYTRKSLDAHNSTFFEQEERKMGHTSYVQPQYQNRPRFSSNEKKYDYQTEIDDSTRVEPRDVRPRTPSASDFGRSNKFDSKFVN